MFFKGKLIFLRPVAESDISRIAKWLNDPEVTHYMFYGQLPTTKEQVKEMILKQVNSSQNVVVMLCDVESKKTIGFAGLYNIHLTAHKAELRGLVGEKNFWGKGYGSEMDALLTFYGFDRLNLYRIYAGITSENKAAIRACAKAGFIYEGTLRDDIYRNGRYYDSIRMAILRHEYYPNLYEQHCKKFKIAR